MNEKDEKALVALLASRLHPEFGHDLTREEVKELLGVSGEITDEERTMFETIDPLSLIREPESVRNLVPFPKPVENTDLPRAVGFNRGGEEKDKDTTSRASVDKMREEIRRRLQNEQEKGTPEDDD